MLDEELEKIRQNGVTAEELEKVKNQYRASTIFRRQTALGKAEELQYFAHFRDDPAAINTALEHYMAVSGEDILRVANEYLTPQNRAIIITEPTAATAAGQEGNQ